MAKNNRNTQNKKKKTSPKSYTKGPHVPKNTCGAVKTKDEKPIEIIRGPMGKFTCTKTGGKCPNCNLVRS